MSRTAQPCTIDQAAKDSSSGSPGATEPCFWPLAICSTSAWWTACAAAASCGFDVRAQPAEALLRDSRDQRRAVGEVALGRRVGNAHPPRHLPEGEGRHSPLLDQLQRGVDERLAEIPVMVRPLFSHCPFIARSC